MLGPEVRNRGACSSVRWAAAGLEPTSWPREPVRPCSPGAGILSPLPWLLSLKLPSRDIRCPPGAPPQRPARQRPWVAGWGLPQDQDRARHPRSPPAARFPGDPAAVALPTRRESPGPAEEAARCLRTQVHRCGSVPSRVGFEGVTLPFSWVNNMKDRESLGFTGDKKC